MNFKCLKIGYVSPCERRSNQVPRVLPERSIHGEYPLPEKGKSWSLSQGLHSPVFKPQSMDSLQVFGVVGPDGCSSHRKGFESLTIFIKPLLETIKETMLSRVLEVFEKEIETKDGILVRVFRRRAAAI